MTDDDEPHLDIVEPGADGEPKADNASDSKRIRSKQQRLEQQRREGEHFWAHLLDTSAARREIFASFLAQCHFGENPFAVGPNGFPQVEATFFKNGKRAAAEIFADKLAIHCRANFFLMLDEHDPRYASRRLKDDA